MPDKLRQDLESLRIDRSKKAGGRQSRRGLIALLILAVIVLAAAAVALLPNNFSFSGFSSKAREVEVVMAMRQAPAAQNVLLTAGGYVVPRHRVEVSSKLSGRVEELLVDKGDRVKAGQVLARLDDREIRAQLGQAAASRRAAEARLNEALAGLRPQEIDRAKAVMEEAEANLRTSKLNLERAEQLAVTGVLAQQKLDDARNAHDVAQAQVRISRENYELARLGPRSEQIELARAQVAEAEAAVRWWSAQLENCVIRAPIGGTILERLIERGEMVTTGFVSGRGAKSALVSIADLGDLEVELDINETDIPKVKPEQPCSVSPDSYPDRKYEARVREIAPEANRQKAAIQVKVSILEPDSYLRPETNAKVSFLEESPRAGDADMPRILIPKTAVLPGPAVFLMKEGKAVKRAVELGRDYWGQVEVTSGLVEGEQVIVRGLEDLVEGEKVVPKG